MKLYRLDEEIPWDKIEFDRELSPEELKEVYALARASFTAADLQRYTELDEGVSFEEFVVELEAAQQQFEQGKS